MDPIAEARRQWSAHGWDPAADGMAAVTSIVRAQQILVRRIDRVLKPLGLSFARFEMLVLLSFTRGRRMPMSSASARLQVHPASVTSIVDRLERDGHVRREPHPTDGRATLIVLTEAGERLVGRAVPAVNERVFEDLGISEEDVRSLTGALARFRRAAGDFDDPHPLPEPLG
ncbi:MarR family winged helix-turn-helix transcriptional regulator [Microbacterium sp. No. 7]|uniref:MarR family winged helix-turn-helix transcriptional regulator n=1 Tax=Microbacterium sp. No. 7 TaxID=1714373 RepID=UPI0006D0C6AC|nr:MarR family transcriptional regulator [Microbacterium sp. No. 7]ALJ21889.1 MarR family transcriptional regulator [Microbacterium sp. No. 7]